MPPQNKQHVKRVQNRALILQGRLRLLREWLHVISALTEITQAAAHKGQIVQHVLADIIVQTEKLFRAPKEQLTAQAGKAFARIAINLLLPLREM